MSYFNEDQADYIDGLAKLKPEEKCACGWYRLGTCPKCATVQTDSGEDTKSMGQVIPFPGCLPAPFSVYQRRGFIDCGIGDADGIIEHTRDGEKRHLVRDEQGIFGWREVTAREYLEVLKG